MADRGKIIDATPRIKTKSVEPVNEGQALADVLPFPKKRKLLGKDTVAKLDMSMEKNPGLITPIPPELSNPLYQKAIELDVSIFDLFSQVQLVQSVLEQAGSKCDDFSLRLARSSLQRADERRLMEMIIKAKRTDVERAPATYVAILEKLGVIK